VPHETDKFDSDNLDRHDCGQDYLAWLLLNIKFNTYQSVAHYKYQVKLWRFLSDKRVVILMTFLLLRFLPITTYYRFFFGHVFYKHPVFLHIYNRVKILDTIDI